MMAEFSCDWTLGGFADHESQRIDGVFPIVWEASGVFGVPLELILAVIAVESNFATTAKSSKGAMGLMQLMPGTWAAMRDALNLSDDPWQATNNISAGTYLLSRLLARWPTEEEALAAYFAGSGNVKKYGWEKYKSYPLAVLSRKRKFERALSICAGEGEPIPRPKIGDTRRRAPRRPPLPMDDRPVSSGFGLAGIGLLGALAWIMTR
jgi:soluble lytic murein transglycosylase-like protein